MIPQSYITEWSEKAPWGMNQQVAWEKVHGELVMRLMKE
jgi:hypothetical protein